MKQQIIIEAFKKVTGKTIKLTRVRKPENYDSFNAGRDDDWDQWMWGDDAIYYKTQDGLCYFLALAFNYAIGLEVTEKLLGYNYKIDGWCKEMCFTECDEDPKDHCSGDEELFFSEKKYAETAIPFIKKWLASLASDKERNT